MSANRFHSNGRLAWLNAQVGLTLTEFRVLAILTEFADCDSLECYPSKTSIFNRLGMDRSTVWRAFDVLVRQGLISDTGKRCGYQNRVTVWRLNCDGKGCADATIEQTPNVCADAIIAPAQSLHPRNVNGCVDATSMDAHTHIEPVIGTSKGTRERGAPSRTPAPASSSPSNRKGTKRKGTPLPDDFVVPEGWLADAMAKHSWTKATTETEAQKFVHYYTNGRGMNSEMRDWQRAFQNWCSQSYAGQQPNLPHGRPPSATDLNPNATRGKLFINGAFVDG